MKLCPKCGLAQIKAETCFEPCQKIEDYLRAENAKLRAVVEATKLMRRYQKTRHDRHLGCHSVDGHGMRGYCDCWETEKQTAEAHFDAALAALEEK